MGNDFLSRFNRVKKSEQEDGRPFTPGSYQLAGIPIACPHCQHDSFIEGSAQVNTTVKSALLGLDYKKVHTLICTECGYLQWMMQPPRRTRGELLDL